MTDAAITDSVMHMYERVSFITEQAAGWQFCTTERKEQLESGSHIDMQTHASPALTHLWPFTRKFFLLLRHISVGCCCLISVITYSFNHNCQTAGVHQNKIICRPSNIQVNKHPDTKFNDKITVS